MSPRVMEITISHVQTRVKEGGCRAFLSFDECLSDYFNFFSYSFFNFIFNFIYFIFPITFCFNYFLFFSFLF